MRRYLIIALTLMAPLAAAGSAQAVVVNDGGTQAGVALVPVERGGALPTGVNALPTTGSCTDPAFGNWQYLAYQPNANQLCWSGGSVLHQNETFAVTWDPNRGYWAGTRGYVEQFLKDVADGSGSFTSPFALTSQYWDGSSSSDRAQNLSVYGGGCIDYGNPTNSSNSNTTCQFGSSVQTGPGNNYPASGCPATGGSYNFSGPSSNDVCLTDSQIQDELRTLISNPEIQLPQHIDSSYRPLVDVLLPPRVEVCLGSTGNLCSANSNATGQFCSYHSHMSVSGEDIAYVVQPWTAVTGCDEPDATPIPQNPPVDQLATLVGSRLVSPLSQSQIAAIIDPDVSNGWFAADGTEIDDHGCAPLGNSLDKVTTGSSSQNSYLLQREYNNAAAIESDPNTYFGCAPNVLLKPAFVPPSSVEPGDVVEFDGSTTASTLLVPNNEYYWDFGDGTTATGPSVVHSYAHGGNYSVTLTVFDRGLNKQTLSQTIQVLGSNGQPVTTSSPSKGKLHVRILLMPQGLHQVLDHGVMLRVRSNEKANGVAWVSISRSLAKRAGIKAGHKPSVVIGVGTVSGITNGTVSLHLKLSRSVVAKLRHVSNVTLTVRLSLVGTGGNRVAVDAAGRY